MTHRRVLHVIRTTGVSGAENHLAALAAELPSYGWTPDFLLAAPDPAALGGFAARLAASGGRVRGLRMRADVSPQLLAAIRRALTSLDHDLVHTHLVHADWHGGLAAAGLSQPGLVTTKHNHDPFRARQPFKAVEGAWLRRNAAAIAISDSLADFVTEHNGVRPETVLYGWPAGPDPQRSGGAVRSLLAVGRLESQKGFDVLIDALAILRESGHGLRLEIAGEGSERARLQARIERAGLADDVRLLGQRDDVPDLMRSADLFVHPARWEGFGLVLLEAMSAALPIVTTRVGAIPEVIGADGLLVAPDDARALADAVASLVTDPDRAAALGAAGRERLCRRFSPAEMARRTSAVYERALRA